MTPTSPHRSRLWRAYETLAMGLGLGFLGLLCLLLLPAALLFRPLRPWPRARRAARRTIGGAFRLYLGFLRLTCATRFDLRALTTLNTASPRVLVANHPSLIDVILIIARVPDTVCVMKAALMRNPLFGPAAHLAGYIRNDGPLEVVLQARQALSEGAHLLIFPEGGRTREPPLDPLGYSAAMIAQRARVPITVLGIELDPAYLGKHWPLSRPPRLPWRGRLCHLTDLPIPRDARSGTAAIEYALRQPFPPAEPT